MTSYSSLDEVWGIPFPGNCANSINSNKKRSSKSKSKKNKKHSSSYNHNYSLSPLENSLEPVNTYERFTNFNSEHIIDQNKDFDKDFINNNNVRVSYEQVNYDTKNTSNDDINLDEEDEHNKETELLKTQVNELNDKINLLIKSLEVNKSKNEKVNNKNIYDLVLFGIFGLIFILLLESLTKLIIN
jgi:hypothetical protein